MLQEVAASNALQATSKLGRRQAELEEDRRINDYLRAKEQRERELEAQAAEVKAEKEREITRLRAMQERAADRQAAIDELRAKRYQEAKDRDYRQQAEAETSRREATKHEIQLARHQQELDKQRVITEQAEAERDLYLRNLSHISKQSELEKQKLQRLKEQANHHRAELQRQIAERSVERERSRQLKLQEGDALARQMEYDAERLNQLKQQRLTELADCGVNQLYLTELRKHKVLSSTIHRG